MMNLYRYRIVANKNKTKFKLQKKANLIAHLESATTVDIAELEVPEGIIIILFILFPPAFLVFILFIKGAWQEIFSWEDIMEASDPLILAAKKQSHQEQHQFHHKEQEKFTPFLMDL